MQFTEARIKLEGVWAWVKSCGIWAYHVMLHTGGRIRLKGVWVSVKSVIWVAFNIDREAYIKRINAAQKREEAKGAVLTKVLAAKKALQSTKVTNSKLSEDIKKVGRRN